MNSIVPEIVEEYPVQITQLPEDWPRVSDSLRAICHEHAYKIASFDPYPHLNGLNSCRGKLHLIGLLISRRDYSKHHAWMVLNETNLADAIEMTFGKPMRGLSGTLKKMPAIMFQKTAYQRLAGLISDHRAIKVFGHSDEITNDLIDTLFNLPEELRMASVIKHIVCPTEARIIEIASSPDDGPAGSRSRSRFASRLSDCRSRKSFWNAIREELFERFVHLPQAPATDDVRVRSLSTIGQISQAADEFRNCLRMLVDEAVRGEMAFYIFDNGTSKAIISLKAKIGQNGLTGEIDEIKGVKNSAIPPETIKEIESIFEGAGITRRNPEHHTQFGVMCRFIRDLKTNDHPADIERAVARLEDAIYASS